MASKTDRPASVIDYASLDDDELHKHLVDIVVYNSLGLPTSKTALKSDMLKLKHNEVNEAYVLALGFKLLAASGAQRETITLTWRFGKKSFDAEFRIVKGAKYDIALGEEACDQLSVIRRGLYPCVIDKGSRGTSWHHFDFMPMAHNQDTDSRVIILAAATIDRIRQEQERERERQEKKRRLQQQQPAIASTA